MTIEPALAPPPAVRLDEGPESPIVMAITLHEEAWREAASTGFYLH